MAHEHDHQHDHQHDHDHGHGREHDHAHQSIRLAPPLDLDRLPQPVHRVGRRQFLTELGRNTFAVAVLGGLAAACAGDSSDPVATATTPTTPSADDDADTTGAADTAAESAEAGPAAVQWSQVVLGNVSAYVLVRGNRAAVVDTGNPGSADRIGEALGTLGVSFDDVRHVVLTHRHPDHVGSLPEVLERAASAAAYAGAEDIPNIEAPVEITAIGDGDDVFGLEVIETPGHTPGSVAVLDTGIGLLIAGDAMIGNADGTGISGAAERFTADMGLAGESIKKLAGFDVDIAAFGHGNPVVGGAGDLLAALAESL